MNLSINLLIVVITVVVSLLAFRDSRLIRQLSMVPPAVESGQYYRLVTYGFVHADGMHLAFNMITLYFFGRLTEQLLTQIMGAGGYPLFYLAALLISILPSYLKHREDTRYLSLGASGAVSAVLFIYVLVAPWSMIFVFFLPVPSIVFAVLYVLYSLWMDRRGSDSINHSAHLIGGAFGIVFMLIVEPKLALLFVERLMSPLG